MRIALVAHHGSPLTPATGQEPIPQAAGVAAHARALAKLGHRVTIYATPGLARAARQRDPRATGDRRACDRWPAGPACR